MLPKDIVEIQTIIDTHRRDESPYDLVTTGRLHHKTADKQQKIITSFSEVGATWWLESFFKYKHSMNELLDGIEQGFPG